MLPGHGPETTIGHEKRTNPFVGGAGRVSRLGRDYPTVGVLARGEVGVGDASHKRSEKMAEF